MPTNTLLQKTYQYKVYNALGGYLGLLPYVTSDFAYNQNINTAGSQLQITVGVSADTAQLPNTPLLDETGNNILDENSNPIYDERVSDLVGSGNSNSLIQCNNQIKIYEYSNYYPNGLLVFSGYMSKWKTTFGSSDNIIITCLTNGQDLSNFLVASGDTSYITQATDTGNNFGSGLIDFNKGGDYQWVDQTFTVPDASVLIGGISVELTTPEAGTLTVMLYRMVGLVPNEVTDTLIITVNVSLGVLATKTVQKVSFTPAPTLNSGITYYFRVMWSNTSGDQTLAGIYASSSDPYTGGLVYTNFTTNGTPAGATLQSGYSLYFVIYKHGGNVTGTYTNDDPSFMISDILSNYTSQGGLVAQPAGGYSNTNVVTSYTFKVQSILQAIQAILLLAPANWYWYVDPATSILQFASAHLVADITFIKGRHFNELDLEATREGIANTAYFTGGDDGTGTSTNIFVKEQVSLNGNRTGLALLSDNRVNSTTGGVAVARQIASGYLTQNSAETYVTNVTIQDGTMDTNLLKLGLVCGFSGFGTFMDKMLLQIVGINKQPDQVILQLGTLPKRSSKAIADAEAALAYLQTVDNPSTPS